jgi:GNAT superfamily N-acetyltransferase
MEEYVGQAFSLQQVEKELGEIGSVFFIAYVDEEIAGYARFRLSSEKLRPLEGKKSIELQRIYVRPAFINKKVGAALMQHSLDFARAEGFNALWLGVWEKNARGIAFYEKWGFERIGSHDFMLGKDLQTDILMAKYI